MNIGIIGRGLSAGGVTRFINNILLELENYPKHNFILFTDTRSYCKEFNKIKVVYIPCKNKLLWDLYTSYKKIKLYNLDAIIYPKNIIPISHALLKCDKFNIVHDLAYFDKELNEYPFFDTIYMKLFMKLSCKLAKKTFAVSMHTKKDIVEILRITKKKVIICKEGIEKKFKKNKKKFLYINNQKIKKPFLFYCGTLSPRKNMLRTLKAFNNIKNKIPHNFYLAGSYSWKDKPVQDYIKNKLNNRVIKLGKVSEEELVYLYNTASLYTYISLYEGFGLPILEAQACGCPVITSNRTSCPEVAGQGAHIVNPYSCKEIEEGILKILNDKKYRKHLIKKGHENVKRFSWEKTAKRILQELK